MFERIKTTKKLEQLDFLENLNSFEKEKFSLWAYDHVHIKSVEKIIYGNKKFEVLSGSYDENIGCWRLVVQLEKTDSFD